MLIANADYASVCIHVVYRHEDLSSPEKLIYYLS